MSTVKSTTDTVKNPGVDSLAASSARGDDAMLRDGTRVHLRPIHPEDIELERRFIESLSSASRRFRFLDTMKSPSAELLKQLTVINPATDAAYVALLGTGDQTQEIGVARFSAQAGGHDCEFAVTVADAWQHKGLGTLLMQRLIEVAKARGIKTMHSSDAADNDLMRKFAEHLHFQHQRDPNDAKLMLYSVRLDATEAAPSSP
ncbi:MAG: GNAT family N-acetyltransferase [Burkholderiales bacterium]